MYPHQEWLYSLYGIHYMGKGYRGSCMFPGGLLNVFITFFFHFTPFFSPIFRSCLNAATPQRARERRRWSHASSETCPRLTAHLNTLQVKPGSQPHQCVRGNTVQLAFDVWHVLCEYESSKRFGSTLSSMHYNPKPWPSSTLHFVTRFRKLSICRGSWIHTRAIWK